MEQSVSVPTTALSGELLQILAGVRGFGQPIWEADGDFAIPVTVGVDCEYHGPEEKEIEISVAGSSVGEMKTISFGPHLRFAVDGEWKPVPLKDGAPENHKTYFLGQFIAVRAWPEYRIEVGTRRVFALSFEQLPKFGLKVKPDAEPTTVAPKEEVEASS